MEKRDIIKLLDEIFIPLGFKRKGNHWVINGDIIKIVSLQKSNWGNFFYINYGYNIKNLELTTKTHIFKGMGSVDKKEYKHITDLLDLDSNISHSERITNLKTNINNKIVCDFNTVNTEKDILEELKQRSNLNGIPLIVKSILIYLLIEFDASYEEQRTSLLFL